uniref:SPOR domain-containing protein n=1 Tax=Salinarimonas chemoclinalis TaxID=3241599 RepID=UPI00355650CA
APAAQPAAPTGGFAVQLAIRGSEDSARAAFAQLQGQYAGIIGDGQPIIRQAVVNGSTIYRVRVGPYSRERATEACDQIKAAQGDCFVAANQ